MMSSLLISILSKNTTLRSTPLAPKSPRRGPRGRLHNPGRSAPKTRRLWNNTHNAPARASNQTTQLPLYYPCSMRHNYNRINLSAPIRLKVPHRLLISKPHRPRSSRSLTTNPMKLLRGFDPNNCSRPNIFRIILLSKHKLRTHP